MTQFIDPKIPGKSPAVQMIHLACAYADAARIHCQALVDGGVEDPASSVRVLFQLCRQATELFFKGAVALKTGEPFPRTHQLPELYSLYIQQYPADGFEVEVPFGIWSLFVIEELEDELGKDYHITHDQRFRYPVDNRGRAFSDEFAFDTVKGAELVYAFVGQVKTLAATVMALKTASGEA